MRNWMCMRIAHKQKKQKNKQTNPAPIIGRFVGTRQSMKHALLACAQPVEFFGLHGSTLVCVVFCLFACLLVLQGEDHPGLNCYFSAETDNLRVCRFGGGSKHHLLRRGALL